VGSANGGLKANGAAATTVRTVLDLPVVRRAVPEVVSGGAELDRPVRWVHSGEVPHIAKMLKGGELLLTTGMGIGRTEHDQRQFIAELTERGCAALAIELGTALGGIPRPLATQAERRGLPLIAFHHEVRFVEITEAVHREIVSQQLELMRRGEELHHRFTGLMLDGAGIPEVLSALADAIANPVVLHKPGQGVLYHATHEAENGEVLAAWDRFASGLDGAPATIEQPVPAGGEEEWGRLVALAVDTPIDEHDRVATERAVGLIALALLRDREEETVASRERGNFLAELMESDMDEADVRTRAAAIGFGRDESHMLPIVVTRSPTLAMRTSEESSWARTWRDVQRELVMRRVTVIAGTREHERQLLLVFALQTSEARSDVADRTASLVRQATKRHLGQDLAALVCVGSVAASWRAVGDELRGAVDAIPSVANSDARLWHDVTRPDLDRVLFALRDRPELERFTEARLAPLIDSNRPGTTKLLETIATYCEHGGRKAETARALHIERQSLYHRLGRIEELLGADLSDGETLLGLHLALRARRYLPRSAR
jgi:PucR family transcriptional regulator, purine catabolism regulatory protein